MPSHCMFGHLYLPSYDSSWLCSFLLYYFRCYSKTIAHYFSNNSNNSSTLHGISLAFLPKSASNAQFGRSHLHACGPVEKCSCLLCYFTHKGGRLFECCFLEGLSHREINGVWESFFFFCVFFSFGKCEAFTCFKSRLTSWNGYHPQAQLHAVHGIIPTSCTYIITWESYTLGF